MQVDHDEPDAIRQLVRDLGEAGGARTATPAEVDRLRDFFGRRVLRPAVDAYIRAKYDEHVGVRGEWPEDTEPEEYLDSPRETVLDPRSSLYLTNRSGAAEWTIYFVGPVPYRWRGKTGSNRIIVLFNAERHIFITGFQPSDGEAYVERRRGFWVT